MSDRAKAEVLGQHTTSSGLRRSAVTREPSARTQAQDSSPEVIARIDGGTCAHVCRTANSVSLFLVAMYCLYK